MGVDVSAVVFIGLPISDITEEMWDSLKESIVEGEWNDEIIEDEGIRELLWGLDFGLEDMELTTTNRSAYEDWDDEHEYIGFCIESTGIIEVHELPDLKNSITEADVRFQLLFGTYPKAYIFPRRW